MLIDWFTVCAQAINFLILVWLLKRFLYRPVLAAIDAREKRIAQQLENAAKQQAQARAERDDFQKRSSALDQEREKILRAASVAATQERDRLLEGAREEARALRDRLAAVVATERDELRRRLQSQTQAEVFALSRRVLQDLAGTEIEQRMVEVFLTHLAGLPEEQRAQVMQPYSATAHSLRGFTAVVRSAFELSAGQREAIRSAVAGKLDASATVEFEVSPELICGIELSVNGVKLAWSIPDYLASVSQSLQALIDPQRDSQHA
jgi:F-type H+-transporting ATPase subunit b